MMADPTASLLDPRTFVVLPFLLSSAAILIVGLYTIMRRDGRAAWMLGLMCVAAFWWSLFEGLLILAPDETLYILLTKIQYAGILSAPILAMLFILETFGLERFVTRPRVFLASLPLIVIFALAWTYPLHHLHWTQVVTVTETPFLVRGIERGPLYFFMVGYIYLMMAVGFGILIRTAVVGGQLMRKQALVAGLGFTSVWLGNLIYQTIDHALIGIDPTPALFTIVAATLAWGYYRYALLDLFPSAGRSLFRQMSDAMFVLNSANRLVELNPTAQALVGAPLDIVLGRTLDEVLPKAEGLTQALYREVGPIRLAGASDETPRSYELRAAPILGQGNELVGRLVTLRDLETDGPLDGLRLAAVITDAEGTVIEANRAFIEYVEMPREAVLGLQGGALWDFLGGAKAEANAKATLIDLTPKTFDYSHGGRLYECRIFPPDPAERRPKLLCLSRDVTDERLKESRIQRVETLVAVGRMTTEVAYEFSRPLKTIRDLTALLEERGQSDIAQEINETLEQSLSIINTILESVPPPRTLSPSWSDRGMPVPDTEAEKPDEKTDQGDPSPQSVS